MSDLIIPKDVVVVQDDIDRYGRLVGQFYVGSTHINRNMVQVGMAWVYRQYMKNETLLQDELSAREAGRGLWSLPSTEQVPPWEWRRGKRSVSSEESIANNPQYECVTNRYCKEMSSCEEPPYYLENCGLTSLDGDGVLCEGLFK